MVTNTTTTSAGAWRPDLNQFAPGDVIPDAIILQASTNAGTVEGDAPVVRVAYVDDATATFTAEGDEIPQENPDLNEVLIHTAKITQLVRISREQQAQNGTPQQLAESVRRAVIRKANEAFLVQAAPVSPKVAPPAGLLNITGTTVASSPVATDLDNLVDLIAELESKGATPSQIIVGPEVWASLRKIKTATGHATSLLGSGTNDAQRLLLDLPVLVTPSMTPGAGIVVDRTSIVSAVGTVQVASSDQVYFTSDSIALRATWRIGWNVVRPERLGVFSVPA